MRLMNGFLNWIEVPNNASNVGEVTQLHKVQE